MPRTRDVNSGSVVKGASICRRWSADAADACGTWSQNARYCSRTCVLVSAVGLAVLAVDTAGGETGAVLADWAVPSCPLLLQPPKRTAKVAGTVTSQAEGRRWARLRGRRSVIAPRPR